MRLHMASAAVFLTITAAAVAQDLPAYDIDKTCRKEAACFSKAKEASLSYDACRIQEAESRLRLQAMWPQLSGPARRKCLEELGYSSSYWTLSECFDRGLWRFP